MEVQTFKLDNLYFYLKNYHYYFIIHWQQCRVWRRRAGGGQPPKKVKLSRVWRGRARGGQPPPPKKKSKIRGQISSFVIIPQHFQTGNYDKWQQFQSLLQYFLTQAKGNHSLIFPYPAISVSVTSP